MNLKITLSLIVCGLGFSTWNYEKIKPAVEKKNMDKISEKCNPSPDNSTSQHCDSPGQVHSKHEDDNEKIKPAVEKTNMDKISEKFNPSPVQDPLKQNPEDKVLFKFVTISLTGSMPLDTVFFLLIIHMCGANSVAAASTVFAHMFSSAGLIELTVSLLPVLCVTYKWKRDKAELEKKNSELVKDSEKKEQDLHTVLKEKDEVEKKNCELLKVSEKNEQDMAMMLMVNNELENWRNQLRGVLDDVEKKKEENKQKLQSVGKEITEREANFDKPEELLREQENLFRDQWKLDETKKDTERQLLKIEKLMDPIEMQVTRIHRLDKENVQT